MPTYPIAQPADNAAPYTWTQPIRDSIEGVNDHQSRITTLEGATGGSGDAATPYGAVFLDEFAGANDDAKLTAALSAVSADTYPRAIQLRARQYSFSTGGRTPFEGMRIIGPRGYGNPERNSQTKMPGRVHLSGFTGPWFSTSTEVFSVSLHNLSFTGGSNACVLGGTGNWYCLHMRDIFSSGLRSVLGTQAQKILITAAQFDGAWEINNCYNGAFHMGGSDNVLWKDGMLLDSGPAFNTAGSANGQYHIWFDSLEKSDLGPLYITAEGAWNGIRVSGPSYGAVTSNTGSIWCTGGMRIEGRNKDQPCNGSLLRVEGGFFSVRDSWFGYAMASPATPGHSPQDAGVIHHSGGGLNVENCMYDRATGVAETVPFVYANSSGPTRVYNQWIAGRGGSWTGLPRIQDVGSGTLSTDSSVTVI